MFGEVYGLYCVCETCGGESRIRYVGQTVVGAKIRFRDHCKAAQGVLSRPRLSDLPIYRWMRKHGIDNIRIRVLGESESREGLDQLERDKIRELRTLVSEAGVNVTPGGFGGSGARHTPEARAKMRERFSTLEARQAQSMPGEKHPRSTLSNIQVSEIKRRLWSGETARSIALELQIPYHRIQMINSEKSWVSVPWPIGPRVRPRRGSMLSPDDRVKVRALRNQGLSIREVAEQLGVSAGVVFRATR